MKSLIFRLEATFTDFMLFRPYVGPFAYSYVYPDIRYVILLSSYISAGHLFIGSISVTYLLIKPTVGKAFFKTIFLVDDTIN